MENRNSWHVWVAFILALGLIVSSSIVTWGLLRVKAAGNTITVTGSAKKEIVSDLAVWTGNFSVRTKDLKTGYNQLKVNEATVKKYLIEQGIPEKDIEFSSINTSTNYVIGPSGQYTSEIESYVLNEEVKVQSKDVQKLKQLALQATDLMNQGLEFQSYPPQYFYTKLPELKVKMLSLATQDAKRRAEEIAGNAGSKVGALRSARMGVFQITPRYSNEISDYGINDTSSLEKEITAVVSCSFEIR
ncbi:MAG TPA: SIMPL domain-containing protein [Syntrophothermus lipocalidus]|uniref:SIMPL domain-containing protein n=1 Tax=Syntrophothermus lipocalidus (strain DSM 12680 / TGB-C1) TaxID=643648 RepID=D7CMZ2_SYNLT|nr:SIMPL domain-containing protein [Syntrophothermus lipocalidus]ADI02077.1 protein of unknown function DUF541 [Syntrophothermus lipocalidus DSM 12680]HHV76505.1 SIMPL domain-containing protein [Syntrophothermus lipocalidus]